MAVRAAMVTMIASAMLLAGVVCAGPPPPLSNQLYGFVGTNRTLTLASPGPVYDVIGDLVIQAGVTLTIEPGVTLRMAATDALNGGDYPALVEVSVLGNLVADGTAGDSVRFLPASGGDLSWGGITSVGVGVLDLRRVAVRGAMFGLTLGSSGPHVLELLDVSGCYYGISAGGASASLREIRLTGVGVGPASPYNSSHQGTGLLLGPLARIAHPDSADPVPSIVARFGTGVRVEPGAVLQNVVVRDNRRGIEAGGASGTVNYCTVVRNGDGIMMYGALVLNTIVATNNGYGLYLYGPGWWDFVDSWSNAPNYYPSINAFGPNVAAFNPWFVDPASDDFRLQAGSVFLGYSNSSGQIGAWGPGPGPPVPVRKSTFGRIKALYR